MFLFCDTISSITRDTIPEEAFGNNNYNTDSLGRRSSWFAHQSLLNNRRPSLQRQQTLGVASMQQSSPSNTDTDDSSAVEDEDVEFLMKAL